MNKEAIATKLRELRGETPRNVVAEACGITISALAMYEIGERVPKDEIKISLANYYGLPVGEIFFNQ